MTDHNERDHDPHATAGAGGGLNAGEHDAPRLDNGWAGDKSAGGNGDKPLTRAQRFTQENEAKMAAAQKAAQDKRQAAGDLQPVTNGADTSGDIDTRTVLVTFFKNLFPKTRDLQSLTLPALRDLILATKAKTKADLPLLTLTGFSGQPDPESKTGCIRWDGGVNATNGIVLDYDLEIMSLDEAVATLKAMNVRALICTSSSYTAAKPRWRLLLPVSTQLPPEMYKKLVARVHGRFGNIFSTETFTLSQSYYYGRAESNTAADHKAVIVDGRFVDLCEELCRLEETGGAKSAAKNPGKKKNRKRRNQTEDGPRGFEEHIALLGDGPGLKGFTEVLCKAASAYAQTHGPDFDKGTFKELLRAKIEAAPKKPERPIKERKYLSDRYLDKLITSAIDKFGQSEAEQQDEIEAAMAVIAYDDKVRLEVGCALRAEFGDDGFEYFEAWSKKSDKYKSQECAAHWAECLENPAYTKDTLFRLADQAAPRWRDGIFKEQRAPRVEILLQSGRLAQAVVKAMHLIGRRTDFYKRGSPPELVRVVSGGQVGIVIPARLQNYLNRHVAFMKYERQSQDDRDEGILPKKIPVDCPDRLSNLILAETDDINVPELNGVITAPTLRSDGSLLSKPGYDAATGLYLIGEPWPAIPDNPTLEQLRAAYNTLWKPFNEFPFESEHDRAVMLAALLTALIRRALPLAPAFSFDAPQAGNGKTLLATCVMVLADMAEPSPSPECANDEEIRKRILSILRAGTPCVLFDNIHGYFTSSSIEMLLTSRSFSDRLLGANQMLNFMSNILVLFSGNNFQPGRDLVRRVLTSRINAGIDAPEERSFDLRPVAYCRLHRQEMIVAGLTLLRGFIAAGSRTINPKPLGSFEEWDARIRQAVIWLEQKLELDVGGDPTQCVKKAKEREPEVDLLARFLNVAWSMKRDAQWTVAELVAACADDMDNPWSAEKDTLRSILIEITGEQFRGGPINKRKIGRWLLQENEKHNAGMWIKWCGADNHDKVVKWCIRQSEGGT
jgi:hypothetical protein